MRQTEYLVALWQEQLEPLGVTFNSPRDPNRRGSHVSFGHPEGFRITRALVEEMHVIPDFRHPDNIRFGLSPLVTTFVEIHEAVRQLQAVIERRVYERYPNVRSDVT
jgi:kynureninase